MFSLNAGKNYKESKPRKRFLRTVLIIEDWQIWGTGLMETAVGFDFENRDVPRFQNTNQ